MKPYQILLLTLICLHSNSQAAAHEQTSYVNPAATVDLSGCAKADSDCLAQKKNIVSTAMQISLEAIYVENEQASVDRFKRQNEHQAAALWAQYYQSWIICIMVFMIISTGLLMSWKHMKESFRIGNRAENTEMNSSNVASAPGPNALKFDFSKEQNTRQASHDGINIESALEISRDGIKLKSPVIGLIIFAISTYFFAVYVDKVYTVNLFAADAVKKNTADKPEDKRPE
ncbi:hypothetical protein H8L32_11510 [Undibacterium sp. CY18W]|uniref:Transmembrane protein n=1 Tax=Undibacterium hunanense TaxID=2762292 RepID=A0ABR6ZQC5_9BURK|nr:hypothetical protein [Undibacterium hunanense]MBC3918106.1 hypothetical protein [Undibacterium hunanense]